MTKRKTIAVVTGSRAEYSYLRPLLDQLNRDRAVRLRLYVSGAHLVKTYGYTVSNIIKDGFKVARKVNMKMKTVNSPYDLAVSIAAGITGFAKILKHDRPDFLVVFGDRVEPLAAAIAASAMNVPIAHINGGDAALGDIDDSLRHAITKLAHLHFTSSRQSKQRVLKLGEETWRVWQAGALSLDAILRKKLPSREDLSKKYGFPNMPYILLSYQPVTTEWQDAEQQIRITLEAAIAVATKENLAILAVYPNPYPGGYQIIQIINQAVKSRKNIFFFKNFPHFEFAALMVHSSVFVGNSSSGIIEAPALGVPYVSVGTRQRGRERGLNVIEVNYDKDEIIKGLNQALFNKKFLSLVRQRKSPFGNGRAAQKIIAVLKKQTINKRLLQKKITY